MRMAKLKFSIFKIAFWNLELVYLTDIEQPFRVILYQKSLTLKGHPP